MSDATLFQTALENVGAKKEGEKLTRCERIVVFTDMRRSLCEAQICIIETKRQGFVSFQEQNFWETA